mgnify:CR=1 FL=1|jgi:hypothetical protein|nr:MAG TPA: hypothetical protein [Caudoviricetes sp.]
MTYNITLTANHQSLTAEYLPLAAESVQYLTAKVVCETEDWTGREIKAMFGQGCTVYEVPVTGGEITAKQQLNLSAGDWCVWLVGNSARDGEVIPRITTNVAHISVAPTGGTEGKPFPTIPPTVEEQLRADMGDLADLTTEDKSSLVAAINEAAESGGTADAVTYTPQTLTTKQQKQARTNIGAEKAGTGYTKPADGIPKSDLAADVQESLAKADTAISLGLTAATPGQIIKVKTVQDGKPTEWEAVDMDAEKSLKFTKLLTYTITEDELAASPVAFVWGTAQIPNLNDFNVFVLTIVRPDGAKIEFSKWVKAKINRTILGNICGTEMAASPQYAITANRLFGFWISGAYYNPNNISVPVLVAPRSDLTYQSDLPDSEPVTSIGFTSYGADYGLTAGIVVEIWGAK